jgi:hypothetical protein
MTHLLGRLVRRPWLWLAAGLLLAYAVVPAASALDDAYISLHSARVLLQGRDPAYGTAALVGATSPPYVALLAGLLALHLPALRLASAMGLVAFLAGLWVLGRTAGLSAWQSAAAAAAVLVSGLVFVVARNGIETGWALAGVVWLMIFASREQAVPLAVLAGLLPALRPDLAPTAALVFLYGARSRSWPDRARMVAIAALVAAPWFLWIRFDTGVWLPQTMRAKEYWFAEGCEPLATRVDTAMGALGQVSWQLLPLLVGLPWLLSSRLGRIGLLAIAITLGAYVLLLPGGLYHNFFRYPYAFMLPWIALGFVAVNRRLSPWGPLILLAIALTYAWRLDMWPIVIVDEPRVAAEMQSAAAWVAGNVPDSAVVLVHDAGAISEFGHRRVVDMVGLKTPGSIPLHERYTWTTCGAGRARAVSEIARRSGASYLIVIADWAKAFRIPTGLHASGFDLVTVRLPPDRDEGYYIFTLHDREEGVASAGEANLVQASSR